MVLVLSLIQLLICNLYCEQSLICCNTDYSFNTIPSTELLAFFQPTRSKPTQTGQTRYHSTPFYLYIQNIKLVFDCSELCLELEWENPVFTPYCQLSCLPFSNLRAQNQHRQGKLGIIQLHSTCTFRISSWFLIVVNFALNWNGKIQFLHHTVN